jgi:hypothetical protein
MPAPSRAKPARKQPLITPFNDRYEATFVVSNNPNPTLGRDFNNLQAAINALPPTGGKIFVKAGVYPISSTIKLALSNVNIQGEGIGITQFVADSSMTGNTPALEAYNPTVGTQRALLADTARGDTTITLAPADAASFAVGDYVLLYSDKPVDYEIAAKHAGEVKRITAIDPVSGTIRFDDQIFDTYTTADSAQVIRIAMLHNITLSDFSITTSATQSSLTVGFMHFRFIDNLQIQRVESHDAFHSGIQVQSVLNSKIADCYIHHIKDVLPVVGQNERYGIAIGGASQNLSISGCRFSHTRHAITTGASSGTNQNGVQRNIVVANCTSMLTDTAHFDTHEPVENLVFTGCVAIGGLPAPGVAGAYGFQLRGHNCSIIGCSVLQAVGEGIHLFGPGAVGAVISGNMIANVQAVGGLRGVGIFLDGKGQASNATSHHTITGNVIKNCDGSAIMNGGSNDDLVISNNIIENVNAVAPGAAIHLTHAARVLITGNNISGSGSVPVLADADAVIVDNPGYNPIGNIANPWPASGDLTNQVAAGSQNPQSDQVYTVRQSPKTIVVAGDAVSQITINGAQTGLAAGVFKLGIGETIAITYSGALTTRVFAE